MKSTSKLYELYPDRHMSRDAFEEVLGAMARAGLVRLSDPIFEKNGTQISYRKVSLTCAALSVDEKMPIEFVTKDKAAASPTRQRRKGTAASARRKRARKLETPAQINPVAESKRSEWPDLRVEEALRAWRLREAKRRGVPAFRIFSDQVLRGIANNRPSTARELLAVPGSGSCCREIWSADLPHLA
jgi:DNA topoisomerase-3